MSDYTPLDEQLPHHLSRSAYEGDEYGILADGRASGLGITLIGTGKTPQAAWEVASLGGGPRVDGPQTLVVRRVSYSGWRLP